MGQSKSKEVGEGRMPMGGSMEEIFRQLQMQAQMAEYQRLAKMKPSERAAVVQEKRLARVEKQLLRIDTEEAALKATIEREEIDRKLSVRDGKVVEIKKCENPECPTHEIVSDPSRIDMTPENYVEMVMKAEKANQTYLLAMMLQARLELLEMKQELSEPLPDMREVDAAWEAERDEMEALEASINAFSAQQAEDSEDEDELSADGVAGAMQP